MIFENNLLQKRSTRKNSKRIVTANRLIQIQNTTNFRESCTKTGFFFSKMFHVYFVPKDLKIIEIEMCIMIEPICAAVLKATLILINVKSCFSAFG